MNTFIVHNLDRILFTCIPATVISLITYEISCWVLPGSTLALTSLPSGTRLAMLAASTKRLEVPLFITIVTSFAISWTTFWRVTGTTVTTIATSFTLRSIFQTLTFAMKLTVVVVFLLYNCINFYRRNFDGIKICFQQ